MESVEHHPAGYTWSDAMIDVEVLDRFEGGAIYSARSDGAFWIVVDEGTLADFLPPDDPTRSELIRLERYGDVGTWEAAVTARKQAAEERLIRSGPSPWWNSYEEARAEWQESFLERKRKK